MEIMAKGDDMFGLLTLDNSVSRVTKSGKKGLEQTYKTVKLGLSVVLHVQESSLSSLATDVKQQQSALFYGRGSGHRVLALHARMLLTKA